MKQSKTQKKILDLIRWNIKDCKEDLGIAEEDKEYADCMDLDARIDCMEYLLGQLKRPEYYDDKIKKVD